MTKLNQWGMSAGVVLILSSIITGALFVIPVTNFAAVYRWTDRQGHVHFSDTPHEGAKKIQIQQVQTYTPVPLPNQEIKKKPKQPGQFKYTQIKIHQPANEATIRNNNGYVAISLQLKPALAEGDMIQLYFDGKAVGKPQTSTVFILNNVYRGEHRIEAAIVNPKGKVLLKSHKVIIYMHRARVGQAR